MVGRICWKGRFWAWRERVKEWWMTRVGMMTEIELRSGWGGESRQEWWGWRNEGCGCMSVLSIYCFWLEQSNFVIFTNNLANNNNNVIFPLSRTSSLAAVRRTQICLSDYCVKFCCCDLHPVSGCEEDIPWRTMLQLQLHSRRWTYCLRWPVWRPHCVHSHQRMNCC